MGEPFSSTHLSQRMAVRFDHVCGTRCLLGMMIFVSPGKLQMTSNSPNACCRHTAGVPRACLMEESLIEKTVNELVLGP